MGCGRPIFGHEPVIVSLSARPKGLRETTSGPLAGGTVFPFLDATMDDLRLDLPARIDPMEALRYE